MTSVLYAEKTIETKMFLLPNIQNSHRKLKGIIRMQEYECSNYYGEEIKDPIFKNDIHYLEKKKILRSFTSKKTPLKSKISNHMVKLKPITCKKLFDLSKQKESIKTLKTLYEKKSKKFINLTKIDFPYSRPVVNNSYTKIFLFSSKKNKNSIISSKILI